MSQVDREAKSYSSTEKEHVLRAKEMELTAGEFICEGEYTIDSRQCSSPNICHKFII